MKLVFLVTLFFLASDWPTPSVCWPALNQQYGSMESTPLSAIFGQQMLANQLNGYGMNTMYGGLPSRFNPDLMKALTGATNDQQFGAFNRVSNHGKSKKLSNTKFMLKPFKTTEDEAEEKPIEELVDEAPALTQKTIKQEVPLAEHVKSMFKSDENVDKVVKQATTTEEEQNKAAAKIQQQQQLEQLTKTVEAAKAKETAAATEEIVNKLVQQQQQQQKVEQTSQTSQASETSVEQTLAESAAKAEHPNVKAVQQQIPEFHQAPQPAYTSPSAAAAAASESVRTLSSRNRASPQQQQQTYNPMYADDRQLQFKLEVPDNINSVGFDTIKNEMTRQLNIRKLSNMDNSDNKYQQQPQQQQQQPQKPQYNANNYRTSFGNPFFNVPQPVQPAQPASSSANPFSSLIIIVNSNANSNLGVTYIDTDLFKSFLSQFAGKSVDDVLRDASLEEAVKAFNRERERTTKNGKETGKESKDSQSKSNKNYESVSTLRANVPTYSSSGNQAEPDSHSESTVLLRRDKQGYANTNPYGSTYANPYANPENTYSYVPYGMGGLIVINNANNNINKRIRSVLTGKEINTSKYDTPFALKLSNEQTEKLMEDAIIVHNDNSNTNVS